MITTSQLGLDIQKIRARFPILNQKVNGQDLVYLDNAASNQKPIEVIQAIDTYYKTINSNVHRGVHHLSQVATDAYELSREKVRKHLNAAHTHEVIFTRGTTESINLVASGLGKGLVKEGDEIVITAMEHHSNIVPWQMLCEQTGAKLRVIPMNSKGELELEEAKQILNEKTKLLSFCHVSNALGTINPAKELIQMAHAVGAWVMVDGAQATPHLTVDVQALDADFYAFSSHKIYGPTGIGILYGKEELLNLLPPYQGGGEMIKSVSFEKTTYAELPHKFEAGTPSIAEGVALGSAIDFMNELGMDNIAAHENALLGYAHQELKKFANIRFVGEAKNKASVVSFLLGDHHPFDVGMILDKLGIAVRTGHHCTQPIMAQFEIPGTVRASFSVYNTFDEVDKLIAGLKKVEQMLG